MRAQLGAFALVDDALEQRAKDGGVYARPILVGCLEQCFAQVVGNLRHKVVVEQRAVEVANLPQAKGAAGAHAGKQIFAA